MKYRIFMLLYGVMVGFTAVAGPWPEIYSPIRVGDVVVHLLLVTIFSVLWPLTWLSYALTKIFEISL